MVVPEFSTDHVVPASGDFRIVPDEPARKIVFGSGKQPEKRFWVVNEVCKFHVVPASVVLRIVPRLPAEKPVSVPVKHVDRSRVDGPVQRGFQLVPAFTVL